MAWNYLKQFFILSTIGAFLLWEFLANTQGSNFTGVVSLSWTSQWSFLHGGGVGPLGNVTSFDHHVIFVWQFQPWRHPGKVKAQIITKKTTMRKEVKVKGVEAFLGSVYMALDVMNKRRSSTDEIMLLGFASHSSLGLTNQHRINLKPHPGVFEANWTTQPEQRFG